MKPNLEETPRVVIFATSLNPKSRSQILARYLQDQLRQREISAELIDLRDSRLPVYGGAMDAGAQAEVKRMLTLAEPATHIVFACPVYNFGLNAATKNLMEHLGYDGLKGKTVGLMTAAGGAASFMSMLPFANSLMLDFRCWIVPRFIQATGSDFEGDAVKSPDLIKRIDELMALMLSRATATVGC